MATGSASCKIGISQRKSTGERGSQSAPNLRLRLDWIARLTDNLRRSGDELEVELHRHHVIIVFRWKVYHTRGWDGLERHGIEVAYVLVSFGSSEGSQERLGKAPYAHSGDGGSNPLQNK